MTEPQRPPLRPPHGPPDVSGLDLRARVVALEAAVQRLLVPQSSSFLAQLREALQADPPLRARVRQALGTLQLYRGRGPLTDLLDELVQPSIVDESRPE